MLAVADCYDGKGPPPPELRLMWECQDFPGTLPYPGALLDQPAGLVKRMRACQSFWLTLASFRHAKSWSQWQASNSEGWKLISAIERLRKKRRE